jgi:hypothetical protein
MNLRDEIARRRAVRSAHPDEGAREYEDAYNRALANRLAWTDAELSRDWSTAESGWGAWSSEAQATVAEMRRRAGLSAHERLAEAGERNELRREDAR